MQSRSGPDRITLKKVALPANPTWHTSTARLETAPFCDIHLLRIATVSQASWDRLDKRFWTWLFTVEHILVRRKDFVAGDPDAGAWFFTMGHASDSASLVWKAKETYVDNMALEESARCFMPEPKPEFRGKFDLEAVFDPAEWEAQRYTVLGPLQQTRRLPFCRSLASYNAHVISSTQHIQRASGFHRSTFS